MSTAGAVAAAARRVERKLVEHLRSAGALSAASAAPIPDRSWMGRRVAKRLVASGAVREAGGGYYLDEAAYAAHRSRRSRTTALIMFPLVIVSVVIAWWASTR